MITSPVIVTLKSNPALGEGILLNVETLIEPAKDKNDEILRDSAGNLTMVKKRECLVCWLSDRENLFIHDLEELAWVEVVAVRTYDEMKEEIIGEVLDELSEEDSDEEESDELPEGEQPEVDSDAPEAQKN